MFSKREIENTHFLAYMNPIRVYWQKRWDIDFRDFELLGYLWFRECEYGKFNKHDMKEAQIPMSWKINRIRDLVDKGFIKMTYKGKPRLGEHDIWGFTSEGKRRMRKLYKMLLGIDEIPMNHKYQPFLKDGRKMRMINKCNRDSRFQK